MSYSRTSRYASLSHSPYRHSRSVSRSLSRSRSRSRSRDSSDVENPGNNLYVTGLSPRMTKYELERHFSSKGKVVDIHLVVDPWTRESRGFGFVTMASLKDADRCLKYLDQSILEGRVITVEKARRRRGRTPTPGRYLGVKTANVRRRSPSYSPYRRGQDSSPCYSSERLGSYSPCYRRYRSRSRSRSRSPYGRYSSYSRSLISRRGRRSYSRDSRFPSRSGSPYHRRRRHYRSISRSISPRVRNSRRSYSRSASPRSRSSRSCSRSYSPRVRRSKRCPSYSALPRRSKRGSKRYSRESYSHSCSESSPSRSVSRSPSRST